MSEKISQVKEFMVVGPDNQGLPNELAENPVMLQPGETPEEAHQMPQDSNPFAGPRDWCVKWFGPFFSASHLPANRAFGLYLVYVGNYPLFVSSSANIEIAITRHLAFAPPSKIIAIDLLGREILHYKSIYNAPLSIKTGLLFEDGKLIHPQKCIAAYRRAAAAIAFCHAIPCNKYARLKFEFEALKLTNAGKFFPLKSTFHAEPEDPIAAAEMARAQFEQTNDENVIPQDEHSVPEDAS